MDEGLEGPLASSRDSTEPVYPQYSLQFRWTALDGTVGRYAVVGFTDRAACIEHGFAGAKRLGWTAPRWWQWWRWDDYPRTDLFPSSEAKTGLPNESP